MPAVATQGRLLNAAKQHGGNFDKFVVGVRPKLPKLMIEHMADYDALVARCLNAPDFGEPVFDALLHRVYETVTTQQGGF